MAVDPKLVKELREKTNAGIMVCRKALEENGGDMAKAEAWIRAKGLIDAGKAAGRATNQGKVGAYIHSNGKGGAMVELCCETDFVAKGEEFEALLRDICLHVYGSPSTPQYIAREEVPATVIDELKKQWADDVKGKPAEVADKILQGKLDKNFYSKLVLLEQPFVKDPEGKLTVGELIKSKIATFKENIVVRRFSRFEVGA
jgi:elongation factor Ts